MCVFARVCVCVCVLAHVFVCICVCAAIRYQCLGSWYAMVRRTGYTFAAIADTAEQDPRERYTCLVREISKQREIIVPD